MIAALNFAVNALVFALGKSKLSACFRRDCKLVFARHFNAAHFRKHPFQNRAFTVVVKRSDSALRLGSFPTFPDRKSATLNGISCRKRAHQIVAHVVNCVRKREPLHLNIIYPQTLLHLNKIYRQTLLHLNIIYLQTLLYLNYKKSTQSFT